MRPGSLSLNLKVSSICAFWKHASPPSPVKARLSKSAGKVISIFLCYSKGIILNPMLPANTTVNEE